MPHLCRKVPPNPMSSENQTGVSSHGLAKAHTDMLALRECGGGEKQEGTLIIYLFTLLITITEGLLSSADYGFNTESGVSHKLPHSIPECL